MRLSDMTPDAVAREAMESILLHLQSYTVPLMAPGGDPLGVVVPDIDVAMSSTLGFELRAVVHYALTGEWLLPGEVEDRGEGATTPEQRAELTHSFAWDALAQCVSALYASPLGRVPIPLDADADPDTAWGLVLLACGARRELYEDRPVSAVQLAALAGLSRQRVHQLVEAGELERHPSGGVRAGNACGFLRARRVAGIW